MFDNFVAVNFVHISNFNNILDYFTYVVPKFPLLSYYMSTLNNYMSREYPLNYLNLYIIFEIELATTICSSNNNHNNLARKSNGSHHRSTTSLAIFNV